MQSRNFGSTPLKNFLREKSNGRTNSGFYDKQNTAADMISECNGNQYVGPFYHILNGENKEYFKEIVNKEYMVPTSNRFGGDPGIRGHAGKIENGMKFAIEYYLAIDQTGRVDSTPVGGFTGFELKSDREKIPIILTAASDGSGQRVEIQNQSSAVPLTKSDFHSSYKRIDIQAEKIMDLSASEATTSISEEKSSG